MAILAFLRVKTFWQIYLAALVFSASPSFAFSASVSYTYDTRHRLTNAVYDTGASVGFIYDSVSNRHTESSVAALPAVYEDAENGDITGWDIYDNDPPGASITNVEDSIQGSRVIKLSGDSINNGYRLLGNDGSYWNQTDSKILEWSMNFSESFMISISVQTKDGPRYLTYSPVDGDGLGDGTYVHHGLGTQVLDDNWHTFIRDLSYDLKDAQPTNELNAVLGLYIMGSGSVDNIMAKKDIPAGQDSDSDGLTDNEEIGIYGTLPYNSDSDNDGTNDNDELTYWGDNWNGDNDNDGTINLLDPDAQ